MHYYLVRIRGTQGVDVFTSDQEYEVNNDVLVSSDRGLDLGKIVRSMHVIETIGSIQSLASEQDIETYWKNVEAAKGVLSICKDNIKRLKLGMNLMSVHYNLDQTKVFVEYTANERVDFRDLLKELSKEIPARIELKQLGPRDHAKVVGGLGVCGREACCVSKSSFQSITISMAKNQMIPINNDKLTGMCGKLKCCLAYENGMYVECRKKYPKLNSKVIFADKEYRLSEINCVSSKMLLTSRDERLYVTLEEFNEKGHKA